jgi:hypothetical protein
MYLVLLYIIIIFVLFMSCNKLIEGQEIDSGDMSGKDLEDLYGEIYGKESTENDIRSKQIEIELTNKEIKLQVYLTNTVSEFKNILSENNNIKIPIERMELIYDDLVLRDNYMLFQYGIEEGDKIHLEDNVKIISEYGKPDSKLFRRLYGEDQREYIDPYERYLKEFLKYNRVKKKKSNRMYSKRISNLLENKSKPYLKPYNKYQYLDDNLNNKLKEDDDLVGPNPYIDDPDLYDRIIQENVDGDTSNTGDNDKKICCDKTSLDISNPILVKDNLSYDMFPKELMYENSINDYITDSFKPYNTNYYDEMERGKKIYDTLRGSMRNFNGSGRLTV